MSENHCGQLMTAVCVLVSIQIVIKIVIYRRFSKIAERVETLLILTEKHSKLDDDKANQVKREAVRVADQATATVRSEATRIIQTIPPRVAEEIRKDATGGSQDGMGLPTV